MESLIVKRTHELMKNNNIYKIAIDATVGNGYDTLYLSQYYDKVIGIDIQELAIKRTSKKIENIHNVELYLMDFNDIHKFNYANLIVFNLGYLPGSNKKIKTQDYTSDKAILNAYSILDGILLVACYTKHDGGMDEFNRLINTLNNNNIVYSLEDNFDNEEKLIIINKTKPN